LWWKKKFHLKDVRLGIRKLKLCQLYVTAPMTWSPKKVGGSKRSIIERDIMGLIEVFDNEKEEDIAYEQNNQPLISG